MSMTIFLDFTILSRFWQTVLNHMKKEKEKQRKEKKKHMKKIIKDQQFPLIN